jgi:hypothetical protein
LTVIVDARRNVPLGFVNGANLGVFGADLLEGGWHKLHQPAGADPALGVHVEIAFGHRLGFEDAPVVARAEEPLRILPECVVVAVGHRFGQRGRGAAKRDKGDTQQH